LLKSLVAIIGKQNLYNLNVKKGEFTFDCLKRTCLMTTNAFNATKMLLALIDFFVLVNFILQ